jgi:hypothetical protein
MCVSGILVSFEVGQGAHHDHDTDNDDDDDSKGR